MDTALPQKFPFILDRNLAKANCTGNRVCTSCDIVVLVCWLCSSATKRGSKLHARASVAVRGKKIIIFLPFSGGFFNILLLGGLLLRLGLLFLPDFWFPAPFDGFAPGGAGAVGAASFSAVLGLVLIAAEDNEAKEVFVGLFLGLAALVVCG